MTSVKSKLDDELSSPWFYSVCTMAGMLSAGTTHLAITPLDVLKVNMQVLVSFLCFLINLVCALGDQIGRIRTFVLYSVLKLDQLRLISQ